MSKGIEGLRLIKSIIIGSDKELGNCYLTLALANPKEEIKLFTTEHRRKFYVAKAVRNEYGAIIDYEKISDLGKIISSKYLAIPFRKNDGFLKTNKISYELSLYRQNYCGCKFAKK